MFNAENSNSFPCTWVGHASLVIETIEEGGYFSRVVHLTKENGTGVIKFSEIPREKVKERAKEYAKENQDHIKQRKKKWRQNNPELVREQKRLWRERNRDKVNARKRELRAIKKAD